MAFLLAGGEAMASLHLAVQKLGAASVPLSVRFGPAVLDAAAREPIMPRGGKRGGPTPGNRTFVEWRPLTLH